MDVNYKPITINLSDDIEVKDINIGDLEHRLNVTKNRMDRKDKNRLMGFLRQVDLSEYIKKYAMNRLNMKKISNAYLKQYELLSQMPFIEHNLDHFIHFDNASFPGSFIRATNHYIYETKIRYYDWFASSLINQVELNKDPLKDEYNLVTNYPYRWLMDKFNNGDVLSRDNLLDITKKFDNIGKCHLYTSDLGFDVSEDYTNQETLHLRPHIGQILWGLTTLKNGGNFSVKQFTFFTIETRKVIYILSLLFDKLYIVKPATSKITNSEVYLCGFGYKPNLYTTNILYHKLENWNNSQQFDNLEIPDIFNIKLNYALSQIYEAQISSLNNKIDLYEQISFITEDIKNLYQKASSEWIKMNKFNTDIKPIPITKTELFDKGVNIKDINRGLNKDGMSESEYIDHLFNNKDKLYIYLKNFIGTTFSPDNGGFIIYKLLKDCGMKIREWIIKIALNST